MDEHVDENVERQKKDRHHHFCHGQVYEEVVERNPVKHEIVGILSGLMHEFYNAQHYNRLSEL